MNAQDYDDAIVDFRKVLDIDPGNKAAQTQIGLAKQKIKLFYEKEKNIYGGMFQKFAAADAKVMITTINILFKLYVVYAELVL